MTSQELAAYIREKTRTNSTTLTDSQIIALASVHMDSFAEEIAKANEDFFAIERTGALVADQRSYTLGDDVISLKTVEVKLDGSSYVRLDPFDITELKMPTAEAQIRQYFAGRDPQYDLFNKAFVIYSEQAILTVADPGYKIRVIIYPAHLSAIGTTDMSADPTATTRGFPRQFHELLGRRIIIDWKQSRDKPIPLTQQEQNFDKDFALKVNAIRNINTDHSFVAEVPYDDGSQY